MQVRALVAAACVVVLSGCTIEGTPMSSPSGPRPPFRTASPLPGASPSGTPGASFSATVPEARWNAILADLGERGVASDDVRLVSSRQVTWNNGALGCPKPGVSYTQALVDGQQVIVSAGGTTYDYRFGNSDTPKLCTR